MRSHIRALRDIYRSLDPRQRAVAILEAERRGLEPAQELFIGLEANEDRERRRLLALAERANEHVGIESDRIFLIAKKLAADLRFVEASRLAVGLAYELKSHATVADSPATKRTAGDEAAQVPKCRATIWQSEERIAALAQVADSSVAMVDEDVRFCWRYAGALRWLASEVEVELGCDPLTPHTREGLDEARNELAAVARLVAALSIDDCAPLDEPDEQALEDLWAKVVGR